MQSSDILEYVTNSVVYLIVFLTLFYVVKVPKALKTPLRTTEIALKSIKNAVTSSGMDCFASPGYAKSAPPSEGPGLVDVGAGEELVALEDQRLHVAGYALQLLHSGLHSIGA